jgi:hypothetical protein
MKRAKIAAVKRGSSLRDLVAEALSRLLAEQSSPKHKRMTEAPIKLPPGHTIPIRSNSEIAQLFDQEEITHRGGMSSLMRQWEPCLLTRMEVLRLLTNRVAMNGAPFSPDDVLKAWHKLSDDPRSFHIDAEPADHEPPRLSVGADET